MLTPYLEQLIHEGKATYKTAVTGWGSAAAIVVPNNNYAVITDLLYYPFLQTESAAYDPEFMYQQSFINQIWIRSRLGNNHYEIRPNITDLHSNGSAHYPSAAPIKIDTYLIHDGVIRFSYSPIDSPPQWKSIDFGPLPDISNEESAGFGTASILPSLNVLKSVQFSNNQWYNIPTNIRNPQPANVSGADQLRQNPSSSQIIGITSNVHAGHICNIGYVQIQGKPPALTS